MRSLFLFFALVIAVSAAAEQTDLSVQITQDGGPRVQVGSLVRYRISVRNDGRDSARRITVTVTRPEGAASFSLRSFGLGTCSGLTCQAEFIPATVTVGFIADATFDSARTATFTATASSSETDPNLSNNSATLTTEVLNEPSLFPYVESPRMTEAEQPITINVGALNSGAVPAHDVVLTVTFPAGTRIEAAHPLAGWQCTPDASVLTCTKPLMAGSPSGLYEFFPVDLIAPPLYEGGFQPIRADITTSDTNFRPGPLTSTAFWRFYHLFVVSSTVDAGFGSLREAILQANGCATSDCRMVFRLPESERTAGGWFTIQPETPLPAITSPVTVAGPVGTVKSGTRIRPEVMLDGSRLASGNGLELAGLPLYFTEVSGLAIGNFPGAGISVTGGSRGIHDCFIGTLPNGVEAAPNERGIVASGGPQRSLRIDHNVISGNRRSGITLTDVFKPQLTFNAIGLGADATTPVPNGASGVYLAEGADWAFLWCNDLAYNGDFGLAIHPSVRRVLASLNAIYANRQLGIDFGIDLATPNSANDRDRLPNHPVITAAKFDPVTNKTTIEGTMVSVLSPNPYGEQLRVELYADEGDHPQARIFLATAQVTAAGTFRATIDRDLRGLWVTSIGIRYSIGPWFPLNDQISEISDPVAVQ